MQKKTGLPCVHLACQLLTGDHQQMLLDRQSPEVNHQPLCPSPTRCPDPTEQKKKTSQHVQWMLDALVSLIEAFFRRWPDTCIPGTTPTAA